MEAPEVPTEHIQEHIQEHAHEHGKKASWIMGVALSSALLAGFAAVSSLLAGHHANEAMIDQIRSSDQWTFFQAKGVKAAVLGSKIEVLGAFEKPVSPKDTAKIEEYKKEQADISSKATALEKASKHHLETHVILARSVTFFQVAIAVAAISVLAHKRRFWFVSLGFGLIGVVMLGQGLLSHFAHHADDQATEHAGQEAHAPAAKPAH